MFATELLLYPQMLQAEMDKLLLSASAEHHMIRVAGEVQLPLCATCLAAITCRR
jgi:hypothetical protein